MNRGRNSCRGRLVPLGILPRLAPLIAWIWASAAAGQAIWELTPYRVQVILACGRAPELTPALEEGLASDLIARIEATVGAPWDVTLGKVTPALRRDALAAIDAIAVESLPKESLQFDKVVLVTVRPASTGYRIAARQLDVRTRTWSTSRTLLAWHAAKLRDAALKVVLESFAPLAQIASVDSQAKVATLRVRAGALPSRDPDVLTLSEGDLFQPVVRYNDREGNPSRIDPVPWTLLRVEKTSQAVLECRLHTGLRSPLSGRRRGRVEQVALAVIPPRKTTRLTLKSRTEPDQLLAGYDVYLQSPNSKATEFLGRTDRKGAIAVPPGSDPLRLLLVKHGGALLARLPIVPGVQAELEALVPDDDQRLEAEGFVVGLQTDLVDLVIRRQILLARVRARLKSKRLDDAETLIRELQSLKTRHQFAMELAQEQQKAFSSDTAVQQKIDAMFGEVQKVLQHFLDPRPLEQFTDELAKARYAQDQGG